MTEGLKAEQGTEEICWGEDTLSPHPGAYTGFSHEGVDFYSRGACKFLDPSPPHSQPRPPPYGGKNNKNAPKKPNNYRKLKSLQNFNIFI